VISIKVLYAVSECTPFVKTGGLADVAGSLPNALKKVGCNVRVVLPNYKTISAEYKEQFKKESEFSVKLNNEKINCSVLSYEHQNLTYYLIDNPYYDRDMIYGYSDEGARFAFFSKAVLEMIKHIRFKPDVIHTNDWHLGLLPMFLKEQYQQRKLYQNIKTVMTIHNLKYQGSFDRGMFDYCMFDQSLFNVSNHDNLVNYLKTGIALSDCVTTVSETYAEEIKTQNFGEGIDWELRQREEIVGILNGLDINDFNPKKDKMIKKNYDSNHISPKKVNKEFLQTYFSLPTENVPVVVLISRLVKQKGLDMIIKTFNELMKLDCQLIILGRGEYYYEHFFYEMSQQYPKKVRIAIEFNATLARFMYAGGDFLLMPSLFEPCGLAQMIALRYGTIPIFRQTGGLKDSVEIFDENTELGYGFGFQSLNELDMLNVIKYAFEIYQNKKLFRVLIHNAMRQDFSWKTSALRYQDLYQNLMLKI